MVGVRMSWGWRGTVDQPIAESGGQSIPSDQRFSQIPRHDRFPGHSASTEKRMAPWPDELLDLLRRNRVGGASLPAPLLGAGADVVAVAAGAFGRIGV